MDPRKLREWLSVFQDLVVMAIATFIAIFGTLRIHEATVLAIVLGFSGTLLGVPAFKRFDTRRRDGGEEDEKP